MSQLQCLAPQKNNCNQIKQFVDTITSMKERLDSGEHIPNYTVEDEQHILTVAPCITILNNRRIDNRGYLNYRDKIIFDRQVRLFHHKDPHKFPMPFFDSDWEGY